MFWFEHVVRTLNARGYDALKAAALNVGAIPPEMGDVVLITCLPTAIKEVPSLADRVVVDFIRRRGGPDKDVRNLQDNWTVNMRDMRTKVAMFVAGLQTVLVLCEEDGTPRYFAKFDPSLFELKTPADGWASSGYLLPAGRLLALSSPEIVPCSF